MPRSVIRWIIFTLCLGVFFLAMAWVSVKTLRMEDEQIKADRDAQVQERVRLALWRMDSLAGGLVIGENARPAWHYRAFHSPRELFAKESQEVIPQGEALEPSPLLGEPPENVLLHFQAGPTLGLASPQVPTGADLKLTNQWYVVTTPMEKARQRLPELQALLGRHPDLMKSAQPTITDVPGLQRRPMQAPAPAEEKKKELSKADSAQMEYNNREQSQRLNVLTQTAQNANPETAVNKGRMMKIAPEPKVSSKKLASVDVAKDSSSSFSRSSSGAKPSPSQGMKDKASSMEESGEGPGKKRSLLADSASAPASRMPSPPLPSPVADEMGAAAPAAPSAKPAPMVAGIAERDLTRGRRESDDEVKEVVTLAEAVPSKVTEIQALWVEKQLLLVRQATLDGTTRMQGVWLDWNHLQQSLLGVVKDLLPAARIEASTASRLDPMHLVMLPVRLIPGEVDLPAYELELGRPLRRALGIAWLCFAGAALAVGLVLQRTLALSERRAAFVSAVTHELRTPLTTFQLYSEMLADGMVPEGEKRRSYLNTLCTEAKRLTHLVENVLAYSRIERGRTAGRQETLLLADLLQRIEPRLQQRAEQVDLDVRILNPEAAEGIQLNLDPLAVEQILFNLVDNACKYAAPDCRERVIDLRIEVLPKGLHIHVRDHGPGFGKAQMKKLFQPFAKSATEAAHSAPGVGLGLALCRQLARELGGDLVLESNAGGASFCLKLPRTPDIQA